MASRPRVLKSPSSKSSVDYMLKEAAQHAKSTTRKQHNTQTAQHARRSEICRFVFSHAGCVPWALGHQNDDRLFFPRRGPTKRSAFRLARDPLADSPRHPSAIRRRRKWCKVGRPETNAHPIPDRILPHGQRILPHGQRSVAGDARQVPRRVPRCSGELPRGPPHTCVSLAEEWAETGPAECRDIPLRE
ncbi:hypothetical protein B0T26DRAFT_98478 [Lasiosphaeria miniovina]|uniref:Uncharacterized protein n=1 Tax=Lasiosphaeria miniovina TaxID=1954250 RepID=A0AA40BJ62_9PEZI|nr:uncharacterized protein B0T26DRAFT_98478 [Lasiosphaeria miniovina]KAK0735207.1 hypothetical protein B0T26DRAFT_98478 [Lasiosphaeria miniovina]